MKGIVFNLMEGWVAQHRGQEGWDALLDAADLDGAYTSVGSYPDDELYRLVAAAADSFRMSADDVIRGVGRSGIPLLAQRYPELFSAHADARSFVLSVNDIIHPEVRKLYPGAKVPEFDLPHVSNSRVVLSYRSTRGLCVFAEGLVQGAGDHYGENVHVEQPCCTRRGDSRCDLEVHFVDGA